MLRSPMRVTASRATGRTYLFGLDMGQGPIVGAAGQNYPIARGYIAFRDIDDPSLIVSRSLGEGFEGVRDGSEHVQSFVRPDGSIFSDTVYPHTVRVPSTDIRYCYVTLGWAGTKWIVINLYPARLPRPTTVVTLTRAPNHGHPTI